MKHHGQSNSQEEEFIWAYSFGGDGPIVMEKHGGKQQPWQQEEELQNSRLEV